MRDAPGFECRQAPGWWPSLVIVKHTACGQESGVINLNADTALWVDPATRWARRHRCEGDDD